MTAFLDTDVLVYANTAADADLGERCGSILERASVQGSGFTTSTLVIEELLHLELSGRIPGLAGAAVDACDMLSPLLAVDEEVVRLALTLGVPAAVGAADRLHVATCAVHDIPTIVSADRGLDGIRGLRRVDPLDDRAVARLLGG